MFYYDNWPVLITALEMYAASGVSVFNLPIMNIIKEIYDVLKLYEAQINLNIEFGIVIPNIPGYNPSAQTAAISQRMCYNECFYKYREAAEFILFADLDEVIIATTGNLLVEARQYHFQYPEITGFEFLWKNAEYNKVSSPSTFSPNDIFNRLKLDKIQGVGMSIVIPKKLPFSPLHSVRGMQYNGVELKSMNVKEKDGFTLRLRNVRPEPIRTEQYPQEILDFFLTTVSTNFLKRKEDSSFKKALDNLPRESFFALQLKACKTKSYNNQAIACSEYYSLQNCDLDFTNSPKSLAVQADYTKHRYNKLNVYSCSNRQIVYKENCKFELPEPLVFLITNSLLSGPKPFKRPPGTEHLQCEWVYDGQHPEYVKQLADNRTTFVDPEEDHELPTDCASIRNRHNWNKRPLSQEEADFPIAIARTIYGDYFYQEMTLAAIYQPQNHYCLSLDVDVSEVNKKRFHNLASCFPNIVIPPVERKMNSDGYNIDLANLDCLKALTTKNKKWKYVAVLHSYDLILRTNAEIVQIYKWLNGANDISITNGGPHRVSRFVNWTVNNVKLFKKESKYHKHFETNDVQLTFVRADNKNKMSLSREAVDFMLKEMDIERLINMINNRWVVGTDEVVFGTLLSMPQLMIPGHFTQECIIQMRLNMYATNHATFGNPKYCFSNKFVNNVCVFGIEDLVKHVHYVKHISIKKLLPSFDLNAVVCEVENTYQRTHGIVPYQPLNRDYYTSLQHTCKTIEFAPYELNCCLVLKHTFATPLRPGLGMVL
ncbi:unnamed protein product [Bursaphelenchus okinawaensis]|uniref:Glycosyltransferase family 92 protein n=1 Tax=Bursaphelenchus okinawaensis TaxID=465554 RepID=A0A811KC17_9BILA|nr:unnamed protein product [Bursaphelenchus okinawaensis]CAG9101337.1 unnamed protein product [Bursaphelenchus okinawaensis]